MKFFVAPDSAAVFRKVALFVLGLGFLETPSGLAQTNCAPVAGLVSWWRGEGNALDSVGTNHGTLRNGAGFGPGMVGQAFALDGLDDFVLVPDSASLRLTGALSFELWFKATGSQWGGLFDKRGGGANYGLIISTDYGVQLYYDDPTVFGGDHPGNQFEIAAHFPLPSLNVWHHFAGTYRQTDPTHLELKMYLNGALIESRLFSGNLANTISAAPVAIGGVSGSCCFFQGLIDEVSLYNRALSADEIGRIYAAGRAGKCPPGPPPNPPVCLPPPPGLAAWWPLDGDLRERNTGASLQPSGGPVHAPGAVRQGLRFDGVNDSARALAATNLDVGAGPGLSIELWVNPQDLNSQQALLEWSTTIGPQPGLHLFASQSGPGDLFANLIDINVVSHHLVSVPGILRPGVFQHVLFTYDRSSGFARFYHNGIRVAEANFGNLRVDTRSDLYFGRRILGGTDYWFNGVMDEVSLYNRALTPDEIQALFAAGAAGKCLTNPPPPAPPLITSQPQNLTVSEGEPASFAVTATGAATLRYQWRFQGGPLGSETNSVLSIASAQLAQAGGYDVVVANPQGAVTSVVATLVVLRAPNDCEDARTFADIVARVQNSDLPANRKHPLLVSLEAAQSSLDRANATAAVNQLEAFKQKVRAQVRPRDPALADCLTAAANAVIRVIEQPAVVAAGRAATPALARSAPQRLAQSLHKVSFTGVPLTVHVIEASTNLVHWTPVARVMADDQGHVAFEEPRSYTARFYRLALPPRTNTAPAAPARAVRE